ncbi:hypothetical protein DFQ28_000468 [Apophysomyces sp. BC1034]|nr:hypothetical protein DFQ30_000631 [Apophysomyces sp. BC1015]KAG0180877.1 hypothetical protein DFQ29_009953 [Apophysomyces sp. BC1021]KAG0191293.1 hypothetical protein DFQ28_000468 [Apophysomyces sp. BC1034]
MNGNKITVLYFAAVRDITGVSSETFELSEGWTLETLTKQLVLKHGEALGVVLKTAMYALDMDYVSKQDEATTVLKAGHEVAIIPPVSGG